MTTNDDYVGRLLAGYSKGESVEQLILRESLESVFTDKSNLEIVQIAGALIEYYRDHVLSALAAIRRAAVIDAKQKMSPDQIAQATGLSKVTVGRLVTEHKNYG